VVVELIPTSVLNGLVNAVQAYEIVSPHHFRGMSYYLYAEKKHNRKEEQR
jgi:hypothetical protein